MPSTDFRVQQFEHLVVPGDPSSITIEIPIPVDMSKTRIMLASTTLGMTPVGLTVEPTTDTRDTSVGLLLVTSTLIVVLRSDDAQWPALVTFSLLEYVGPVGGPNEFTVRRGNNRLTGTHAVNITGQNGVAFDEAQKLTSTVTGCVEVNATTGERRTSLAAKLVQHYITNKDNLALHYIYCADTAITKEVQWEVTNWIGSNWTIVHSPFGAITAGVSNGLAFTGDTGSAVYTIDDVGSWDHAFIEAPRSTIDSCHNLREANGQVYRGSSSTEIRLWRYTGYYPGGEGASRANTIANAASIFCISNPEIKVVHQGVYLSSGPGNPSTDARIRLPQHYNRDGFKWNLAIETAGGVNIDAGRDRVVSVITGQPNDANNDAISILFLGPGKGLNGLRYRRTRLASVYWQVQTIQFGLEAADPATLIGSVIDKPDLSITFRT